MGPEIYSTPLCGMGEGGIKATYFHFFRYDKRHVILYVHFVPKFFPIDAIIKFGKIVHYNYVENVQNGIIIESHIIFSFNSLGPIP